MSTPAKRAGNARYLATQKTTVIRTLPEEAETFKSAAETAGQSLQGYILQAVRERMERESANKYYIGIPKTAADQAGERNGITGKEWLIETVKKALEE